MKIECWISHKNWLVAMDRALNMKNIWEATNSWRYTVYMQSCPFHSINTIHLMFIRKLSRAYERHQKFWNNDLSTKLISTRRTQNCSSTYFKYSVTPWILSMTSPFYSIFKLTVGFVWNFSHRNKEYFNVLNFSDEARETIQHRFVW